MTTERTRPRTRGECEEGGSNAARPCPWATCRWNLGVDVFRGGNGRTPQAVEHPEVWEGDAPSCALDLAERGNVTLEEIATLMGVSRQRIEQLEKQAIKRFKKLIVRDPGLRSWIGAVTDWA